ncbi:MAG: Halovirus [Pseudomonadota bacterium]
MRVERIPSRTGMAFVREHHYSHGIHNGPVCWGLLDGDDLVGVVAFATPCSENVRASVWGRENVARVTELHRLVVLDRYGTNTESWLIGRVLHQLHRDRPDIWGVLSFADATQGHVGTIYQATNAIYTGTSSRARFYLDADGRLRHPRQNGVNITLPMAAERGWRPVMREGKHRYLFIIAPPVLRRRLRRELRLPALPYPKGA